MARNKKKRDTTQTRKAVKHAARGTAAFVARLVAALTVVVGTFAGVVGLWWWSTSTPVLAIKSVEIDGNGRAAVSELAPLTGIEPGTNILRLETRATKKSIESHPWIRQASVRRELPDKVRIVVTEWKPRALVALDRMYLVARDGTVFKRAIPGDPMDLPVITGLSPAEGAEAQATLNRKLKRALEVLDYWQAADAGESDGGLPGLTLAEIHVDALRGMSLTLTGESGVPVIAHLGHERFGQRLGRLAALHSWLADQGDQPKEVFLDNHTRPQWVVARVD